jgi:hypothetical protein
MPVGTTNSVAPFGKAQKHRTGRHLVRIPTFNINNINKRLDNFLPLAKAEPDVVSLQELKAEQGKLGCVNKCKQRNRESFIRI